MSYSVCHWEVLKGPPQQTVLNDIPLGSEGVSLLPDLHLLSWISPAGNLSWEKSLILNISSSSFTVRVTTFHRFNGCLCGFLVTSLLMSFSFVQLNIFLSLIFLLNHLWYFYNVCDCFRCFVCLPIICF